MEIDKKYTDYAEKVISGEIVACEYIKLAAQRYLNFLQRDDMVFNSKKVDKVVKFISNLRHYTGKSNGKPFILSDWQFFIVCNIFGFYWKSTNKRVCKKCYIEVGRKNGKSALISAIALFCLIADGEHGAEVDCIANSRQQAKILFDMACNFSKTLDSKQKYLKLFRDKITFNATTSYMQVLASDATTLDGFNASVFCEDETHAAKDSKLYDVLASSQGMREQPLAICITSAGFSTVSFCYHMRTTCAEILRNVKQDDSQFSAIYCIDADDDWQDKKNYIKANPNLDITITTEYLNEQILAAKNNASLEVSVRTKNLGQWLNSADIWISNDTLLQSTQDLKLEDFKGCVGWCGVDLAAVSDLTCLSLMVYKDEKYFFKNWYYLPSSALSDNSNAELYKEWKRRGYITVTEGNVTDYNYIVNDMHRISKYVMIDRVAYDSWNSTQWAIDCTEQGFPLMPFSQSLGNFNRPTKEFERLIKSDKVVIDNNEVTRWCFSNVTLKEDWNSNVKPIKLEAQSKIDGTIAILESLGTYLEIPHYDNQIIAV